MTTFPPDIGCQGRTEWYECNGQKQWKYHCRYIDNIPHQFGPRRPRKPLGHARFNGPRIRMRGRPRASGNDFGLKKPLKPHEAVEKIRKVLDLVPSS